MQSELHGVVGHVRDFTDALFALHDGDHAGCTVAALLACLGADPAPRPADSVLAVPLPAARHPRGRVAWCRDDVTIVDLLEAGRLILPRRIAADYRLYPAGNFAAVRLEFDPAHAPLLRDRQDADRFVAIMTLDPGEIDLFLAPPPAKLELRLLRDAG